MGRANYVVSFQMQLADANLENNRAKSEFLFGFALGRPFLFHLSQDLGHVFHFFPNFPAEVNGGSLLCRHRDTVTRSGIDLDDLTLVQFVFGAQYHSSKVSTALEIIDHDPLNLGAQGPQDVSEQIMSKRTLFMGPPHKHRDRLAYPLVHVNHEDFLTVADEYCATPAGRDHGPDLYFHNGSAHNRNVLAVAGNRQRLGGVPSSTISINRSCTAAQKLVCKRTGSRVV